MDIGCGAERNEGPPWVRVEWGSGSVAWSGLRPAVSSLRTRARGANLAFLLTRELIRYSSPLPNEAFRVDCYPSGGCGFE